MSVIVNDCQFCGRPKDLSLTAANLCECERKRQKAATSEPWIHAGVSNPTPGNRKERRAIKSKRRRKWK